MIGIIFLSVNGLRNVDGLTAILFRKKEYHSQNRQGQKKRRALWGENMSIVPCGPKQTGLECDLTVYGAPIFP